MTQVSSNLNNENDVVETNVSSEEDYKLIEGALLQNPRGRWFLEEYIQRNRPEDTQKLLSAIQRIENNLNEKPQAPAQQDIDPIRMSIIEMSKAIAKTREEIASIKPSDDQENQILTATEELSAIVESTENATNTILEAAEEIQEAAWSLRETGADGTPCDKIDEKTTDIYTACSFQDITGQRTTKVVQALCYIENRVNAMIDIWDLETDKSDSAPIAENNDTRPDNHLLNGPARKGDGLEQNSIDSMLTGASETTAQDNSVSDQTMVDEMSFDAIASESNPVEIVPNSETLDSDDVDAMSFDAIDIINDLEIPEMDANLEIEASDANTQETSFESGAIDEVAMSEVSFDETQKSEENLESDLNSPFSEDLEATYQANQEESISERIMDLSQNLIIETNEESLSTEMISPENVEVSEGFDIESNSSLEENPLLNEDFSLDDLEASDNLDIENAQETETSELAAINPASLVDDIPAMPSLDPQEEEEIDFGDIEVTDLDETSEVAANSEENPITSQDQLNNIEGLDIENLTEIQEQILVTD